ncbi:MAG: pilus assembly protein PilM [Deltaproteobacteria bacterium]
MLFKMTDQNQFQTIRTTAVKVSRAVGAFLTLSLADNLLAFNRVVCISVEATGISMVYGARISTAVSVRAARKVALKGGEWASPDDLAEAVSQFVKDQKITGAKFVFLVPRSWVMIQTASFPAAVRAYLGNVVYNELDRLTPLSPGNAFYDFNTIEDDENHLTLLLAAVRREKIERYLSALQNKSIPVAQVSVSSFAVSQLIGRVYHHPHYIYLAADEASCECGAVISHFPVRSASWPVSSWDDANLNRLADEIRRHRDALIKEGHPPRMVIWAQADLYQALTARLADIPAFHVNKDLKADWRQNGRDVSAAALGGFLEAAGTNPQSFNLLAAGKDKKRRKPLALTVLLFAAIAAICAFYYVAPIVMEEQKVEQIDLRLTGLRPEIKKIEALKNEADAIADDIRVINDFKKQSVLTIDALKELTAILPEKTWLTRLKVTESSAEIEGFAAKATAIIPLLESSRLFQRAEFGSPTFRDQRMNTDRFFIKMDLKNKSAPEKKNKAGENNGQAK